MRERERTENPEFDTCHKTNKQPREENKTSFGLLILPISRVREIWQMHLSTSWIQHFAIYALHFIFPWYIITMPKSS